MHTPPHAIIPVRQLTAQVPPAQTLPDGHTWPPVPASGLQPAVAPQNFGSVVGLTHVAVPLTLQSTRPDPHVAWQEPAEQTSPPPHAVPGVPASPTPHPGVAPQ